PLGRFILYDPFLLVTVVTDASFEDTVTPSRGLPTSSKTTPVIWTVSCLLYFFEAFEYPGSAFSLITITLFFSVQLNGKPARIFSIAISKGTSFNTAFIVTGTFVLAFTKNR